MKADREAAAPGDSLAALPAWFPTWAREFAELYYSGTTSMFVLSGNVFDHVRSGPIDDPSFTHLSGFVAEQLFGRWDLVLHFDLAHGLRALAGKNQERLQKMVELVTNRFGELSPGLRDPDRALYYLDRLVQRNIMAEADKRLSVAVVVEHASYVVPRGEPGRLATSTAANLVTLLNWAASPYVKRMNMAFALIDPQLPLVNERLAGNPNVACITVDLPRAEDRQAFIAHATKKTDLASFSDFTEDELAGLTAGISLSDLETLVRSAQEARRRLDAGLFRNLKKRLLERQAQGLLEFVQPKWGLDMVVGHEAVKARLCEDAELLKRGRLDCVPMGYLLCGPVGTGKSFLAQCTTGTMGVPCVMLKNFRSKYVGETEANLERVLSVLRAMGPVIVVIDEADAALGSRGGDGDSGTSNRVFAMIAQQMGNTRYRGKIIWMLLTCRPDLLPIDLKRQGRAEVHMPLFYPVEEAEITQLFVVLAKKLGASLEPEDVPEIPHRGDLSGADIEGLVGRALRRSLLAGSETITKEALAQTVAEFMPSTQSIERNLQETAAVIECTNRQFLPDHIREDLEKVGGRAKLQERLTALKRMVERL